MLILQVQEKTFKIEWEIPDWNAIQNNIGVLTEQKITFDTLLFKAANVSWEVGFFENEIPDTVSGVMFFLKLLKLPADFKELEANIKISLLNLDGTAAHNTAIVSTKYKQTSEAFIFQS